MHILNYGLVDPKDLLISQSGIFVDSIICNAKNQIWILYSVKLSDCILWNDTYQLRKRKPKEKTELQIRKPKNLLTFLSSEPSRETTILPPTETQDGTASLREE